MPDDDFQLRLGRIGGDRAAARRIRAALQRGSALSRSRRTFTGERIGRGAGVGAILSAPNYRSASSGRRVVVKASIVRLGSKGLPRATAHLRYLQRDGTTREGERGRLYGADGDTVDGKAFVERGQGDRHQFRLIVAPEDGAEYDDLKQLVRRWMKQVEQDLGTELDWVAVDHFNTGHSHAHVVVRGKDALGKDLIIARNYFAHGLRERAVQLVDLDLGPRSPEELRRAAEREIEQERFTGIDRRLMRSVGEDGLVRPAHVDGVEQSLRAGRLQTLGRMELATEGRRGEWRLSDDLELVLRRMGEKHDIMRTMQREMREHLPERGPGDCAIDDPQAATPIIGKVIARGLSDEHRDRHYLIVDATDGLSHWVDIGEGAGETARGSIVRVAPTSVVARAADSTVAEIAQANGGHYSVDLHLRHDPNASEAFAQAHVRRLEALRRASDIAERNPDGSWIIAPDHLARVEAHERARAAKSPVVIETLSPRPIEQLAAHDGPTWLDRTLIADGCPPSPVGFGAELRGALGRRQQWLIEQQLAAKDGDIVRYRANMLAALQQRELRAVAARLAEELGLKFSANHAGERIEGVYTRAVTVGDTKYALIEKSREFSLVPWRPVLEPAICREVSGMVRDSGISWTIGRGRSRPEIGSF
jgi:type IV secretory pathway VirD2 relaxase